VLGLRKEGQVADGIDVPTCGKGVFDKLNDSVDSADGRRLRLTTCYVGPNYVSTSQKSGADVNCLDDRTIRVDQLRAKVCENNMLLAEQQELYGVLIKYRQHLTNRPAGVMCFRINLKLKVTCLLLQIEGDMPPTAN
jgi:hypothetical protein